MIVRLDGSIAMIIGMELYKRIVDSVSGNPTAKVQLECFLSRADLINNNTGTRTWRNISGMADMTMYPKTLNEMEQWIVKNLPTFEGARHEPT